MNDLIKDFLNQKTFVIAGSFRHESKYAYRIFRDLISRGYRVFPVNPGIKEVDKQTCYKTIKDIPAVVDVANLVTPPSATEVILQECLEKGIKRVWLQPGAESRKSIDFCRNNGISVIYNICVMLERLKK
jgi:uncharacterized protein